MHRKKEFVWLYPVCALVFSLYVLTHPIACSFYTKKALDICFTTLIPSLFPFVFASSFFACVMPENVRENFILNFFAKLFGVSHTLTPGVILGLFSGFPTGAVFVTKMYERGFCSKNQAVRAICLSNNCSASFLIGIAGTTVLGSAKYGVMLLACQITAVIITSQILKITSRNENEKNFSVPNANKALTTNFSKALTESIKSSSMSMLFVSGFVVFFYTLSSILNDTFFPTSNIFKVISGTVLEISTGTLACQNLSFPLSMVFCAFCICFPSLSVLFQIKSITDEHFDITRKYILSRLCISLISAICACIIVYSNIIVFLLLCGVYFSFSTVFLPLGQAIRQNRVKNAQKKL